MCNRCWRTEAVTFGWGQPGTVYFNCGAIASQTSKPGRPFQRSTKTERVCCGSVQEQVWNAATREDLAKPTGCALMQCSPWQTMLPETCGLAPRAGSTSCKETGWQRFIKPMACRAKMFRFFTRMPKTFSGWVLRTDWRGLMGRNGRGTPPRMD